MKKIIVVFILVTIPFLLLGQKEKVLSGQREIKTPVPKMKMTVEMEPPFKFISQEFKGSVKDMKRFMDEFTKNFFDQQLIPNGQPMAIFHNEPKNADDKEVKFEIGFPVGDNVDVKVKSPLKIQDMRLSNVMKHVHTGPYEELFSVYENLKGMVKNNSLEWGKGFTIHRFLNNPDYVNPDEIKTEVIVPVQGNQSLMEIKKTPPLKVGESINYMVMYKSYKGSVSQIGDFVQDFLKEFFAVKRSPAGQPMIIFANVPMSPNDKDLKMDIGFPITEKEEKLDTKSPFKVRKVQMNNVARQKNFGPYEKIFETHKEMLQAIKRQSYETRDTQAILILLNNPSLVKPEEIKSEIIIPAGK